MPRGKNYVNNQRGVHLQAKAGGKGGTTMKMCEYGSGCQRPDCIYRHDEPQTSSGGKVDLCIPFLAGKCTFEKGCRKRHPSKDEIPRLLARYKKTRCRFRDECYTEGCLFLHPKEEKRQEPSFIAPHHFPPLSNVCTSASSSSADSNPKQATASDSVWKKNPPKVVSENSTQKEDTTSFQSSSSQTSEPQLVESNKPATVWGHPNGTNGEQPMMTDNPPMQQPLPPVPPSQQGYFDGPPPPIVPMMMSNMEPSVIDPNTGYPIDPSVYYYGQQSFYYEQQQMIPPYPMVPMNGVSGPPMGIPFNAEAKEFVPGMFAA